MLVLTVHIGYGNRHDLAKFTTMSAAIRKNLRVPIYTGEFCAKLSQNFKGRRDIQQLMTKTVDNIAILSPFLN